MDDTFLQPGLAGQIPAEESASTGPQPVSCTASCQDQRSSARAPGPEAHHVRGRQGPRRAVRPWAPGPEARSMSTGAPGPDAHAWRHTVHHAELGRTPAGLRHVFSQMPTAPVASSLQTAPALKNCSANSMPLPQEQLHLGLVWADRSPGWSPRTTASERCPGLRGPSSNGREFTLSRSSRLLL